jgi:hypothetical protein
MAVFKVATRAKRFHLAMLIFYAGINQLGLNILSK